MMRKHEFLLFAIECSILTIMRLAIPLGVTLFMMGTQMEAWLKWLLGACLYLGIDTLMNWPAQWLISRSNNVFWGLTKETMRQEGAWVIKN